VESPELKDMTHNLKPCPFCGDEPTLRKSGALKNAQYMAMCARSCGACNGWKDTVDEAIAAWNNRHESKGLPEWAKIEIEGLIKQTNSEFDSENIGVAFYWKMVGRLYALNELLTLRKPEEE